MTDALKLADELMELHERHDHEAKLQDQDHPDACCDRVTKAFDAMGDFADRHLPAIIAAWKADRKRLNAIAEYWDAHMRLNATALTDPRAQNWQGIIEDADSFIEACTISVTRLAESIGLPPERLEEPTDEQ